MKTVKNDEDRGGNYPLRLNTEASNSANPITVLLFIQNILKSLNAEMTLFWQLSQQHRFTIIFTLNFGETRK